MMVDLTTGYIRLISLTTGIFLNWKRVELKLDILAYSYFALQIKIWVIHYNLVKFVFIWWNLSQSGESGPNLLDIGYNHLTSRSSWEDLRNKNRENTYNTPIDKTKTKKTVVTLSDMVQHPSCLALHPYNLVLNMLSLERRMLDHVLKQFNETLNFGKVLL
jgi:hypothetical protein